MIGHIFFSPFFSFFSILYRDMVQVSIIFAPDLEKTQIYRGMNYMKDLKEWLHDAKHGLEQEREEMRERAEQLEYRLNALDVTSKILSEADTLREENERLRLQLQEEKDMRARQDMQMKEMSKLSASVAGKASQDELLRAIRVFVNKSKRKKLDKRIAIKEMVLEMANANGITLPKELAASIDSLDDEQAEPKIVIESAVDVIADGGVKNVIIQKGND